MTPSTDLSAIQTADYSRIKMQTSCPLCGSEGKRKLGIRGTREYFGADPRAEPHIVTNVVRCRTCDFIYTDPIAHGMELLAHEYYDDPAAYDCAGESDGRAMFQTRLELISAFKSPGRLLDVGAGKGEFLNEALKKGWQVQGVELSASFCRFARETYGIDMCVGRLGEIPEIPRSSFDAITLNHVLEHVEDPQSLLRLIRLYLKKGGVLFIEVPNCDSHFLRIIDLYFRLKGLGWSSRLSPFHPPFHCFGFTQRSLRYILRECGYELSRMGTFSGRDRGFIRKKPGFNPEVALRDMATFALGFIGNRELLTAVARPVG